MIVLFTQVGQVHYVYSINICCEHRWAPKQATLFSSEPWSDSLVDQCFMFAWFQPLPWQQLWCYSVTFCSHDYISRASPTVTHHYNRGQGWYCGSFSVILYCSYDYFSCTYISYSDPPLQQRSRLILWILQCDTLLYACKYSWPSMRPDAGVLIVAKCVARCIFLGQFMFYLAWWTMLRSMWGTMSKWSDTWDSRARSL